VSQHCTSRKSKGPRPWSGSDVPSSCPPSCRALLILSLAFYPLGCRQQAAFSGAAATNSNVVFSAGEVSATANPLVAKYTFSSPVDADVTIEFGPDATYGLQTWTVATPPGGGEVSILVAGMRQFVTYHMRAIVQYGSGQIFRDSDHTFTTQGLPPSNFPQFTVTRNGKTNNGGVELLDLARTATLPAAVVDLDGNVVWYYDYDRSFPNPVRPLPNGHIEITTGSQEIREIDLSGATIRELTIPDMNARLADAGFSLTLSSFHHDVLPLMNGHLVVLCREDKVYNLAEVAGSTTVGGDVLVDLDRNWKPVWTWSAFDHLDVNRHPMDVNDWTHGNALIYSPADHNLLLSMRNQHWILKIDYADGKGSGDLLWRLGEGGDFTLVGGLSNEWFHGQHFPSIIHELETNQLQLAVFDNGARTQDGTVCAEFSGACSSRPLVLRIDEAARTAEIVWQYELGVYSSWGGSIEYLPNGNIEFDLSNPYPSLMMSRVMEMTENGHETVWQLDLSGNLAYRAYRIPSLYPGVQW
jgi:arylsulfate sulfotransferase